MTKHTYETGALTIGEHQPHREDVDFLSIVKHLADLEEQSASIERDVLAAQMAKHPERYIPTQFEQLAELYRDRSDRQTHNWSKHIEEATLFASRTLDRSRLEEVYLIFDKFGPHIKNWHERTYIARIKLDDSGAERLIELKADSSYSVKERAARESSWRTVNGEAAEQACQAFFRESLRAVSEQMQRTDEELQIADKDALTKLIEEYYPDRASHVR